jgi:hypothetical protein
MISTTQQHYKENENEKRPTSLKINYVATPVLLTSVSTSDVEETTQNLREAPS